MDDHDLESGHYCDSCVSSKPCTSKRVVTIGVTTIAFYLVLGYICTWFWVKGNPEEVDTNPLTWPHLVGALFMASLALLIYFCMGHYCESCRIAPGYPHTERDKENNANCYKLTGVLIVILFTAIGLYELVVYTYGKCYTQISREINGTSNQKLC